MKNFTIPTLTVLSLLGTQLALAANPCGEPAGTYVDSDSHSAVSRTISRFKNANGFVYSYELDILGFAPQDPHLHDGETYNVKVVLDGKSAITSGEMGCTTTSIYPIIDGRCIDPTNPNGAQYDSTSPSLFTYAANGDHLNVWEGQIQAFNPSKGKFDEAVDFRFNQIKFSEMNFQ